MTDKKMIESLRDYARAYTSDKKYDLNPGLALMIANRMEQLIALSQNVQNAIDTNKRLAEKLVQMETDFKKAITDDDYCSICGHFIPCKGKACDCYCEGNEATDENGNIIKYKWTCQDFDWGDCPKMDNVPCKECKRLSHFVWCGNKK